MTTREQLDDDPASLPFDSRQVLETFRGDRYATLSGITIEEVTPAYCRARMDIGDDQLNGLGIVHGGAIFTLADVTFAAAANACGQAAVSVNASINFLKSATTGPIYAEAHQLSCTRRLTAFDVRVTSDTGETLAVFQGLAYRKGKPTCDPEHCPAGETT